MKVVILAAGQGTRLRPITDKVPKCLVDVGSKSILNRLLEQFAKCGIRQSDIVVICGYKRDVLEDRYKDTEIRFVYNSEFQDTNMVYSLMCAEKVFESEDELIISYGDIFYTEEVLRKILDASSDYSVVVDDLWLEYWQERFDDPLKDAESLDMDSDGNLLDIGKKVDDLNLIKAQYIGLMKFKREAIKKICTLYHEEIVKNNPNYRKMYFTDLLQFLIDKGNKLKTVPIQRGWFEIDSYSDLKIALEHMEA